MTLFHMLKHFLKQTIKNKNKQPFSNCYSCKVANTLSLLQIRIERHWRKPLQQQQQKESPSKAIDETSLDSRERERVDRERGAELSRKKAVSKKYKRRPPFEWDHFCFHQFTKYIIERLSLSFFLTNDYWSPISHE